MVYLTESHAREVKVIQAKYSI